MDMKAGPAEAARLSAIDEGLRREGEAMLVASGLGQVLREEGYAAVGSYVMHTMTWRDLDFERIDENPDWEHHWVVGARLAKSGWVWKFSCANAYTQPETMDKGLYWGLRLSDPAGGPTWKVDMWTARRDEFGLESRARWTALLTEETRCHILAIKEAVCDRPEYRKSMLSIHIYEAVLDRGIRGIDEFMKWWQEEVKSEERRSVGKWLGCVAHAVVLPREQQG